MTVCLLLTYRNLSPITPRRKFRQTGTEMTQENIDQIGQAETQCEQVYGDRWRDVPYWDDASESWQRGWREANLELSGDNSIEF
jgi:hypothetical protein